MRNILRSISYAGALAPLALAALTGAALAADTTSLRIEVYGLMGLHVLTLHSTVEEAGDRYAIAADYATRGLAGLVTDLSTKAEVRGRLGNPSPHPVSFRVLEKLDFYHSGRVTADPDRGDSIWMTRVLDQPLA